MICYLFLADVESILCLRSCPDALRRMLRSLMFDQDSCKSPESLHGTQSATPSCSDIALLLKKPWEEQNDNTAGTALPIPFEDS